MKNKKVIIISAVAVVLLAAVTASIVVMCSKNNNDSNDSVVTESSALTDTNISADVSDFQKALDDTIDGDNEKAEMPLFLSSLKKACSCKVISVSPVENSNSYTAIINVTYADVADDLVNYLESLGDTLFDEDKLNSDIAELVSTAESATSECEIYFMVEDDIYTPIFTEEIIDKMYGGIYSAYYNKLNEIAEKNKGSEQN